MSDDETGPSQQRPRDDLSPEEAQRINDELRAMATEALRTAREAIGRLTELPQSPGVIGDAVASRIESFELALRGTITELEERMPGGPVEAPGPDE